jgi:hypothetical protein
VTDERLVIVAIPPLVTLLLAQEKQKGSPLDEQEVLAIRGKAVCMRVRESVAAQMAKARGYDDITLENTWDDWNATRPALGLQTR